MENNLSYEEALKEANEIVKKIENEELSVDILAPKVERAVYLLNFCKKKLFETEEEIEKILEKIEE